MGAVGSAKSVVDVDIYQSGQLLCEHGIVLFFLSMETQILQE
jgi:hypothetical protein